MSSVPAATSCSDGFQMWNNCWSTSVTCSAPSWRPSLLASSRPPAPPPTITMRVFMGTTVVHACAHAKSVDGTVLAMLWHERVELAPRKFPSVSRRMAARAAGGGAAHAAGRAGVPRGPAHRATRRARFAHDHFRGSGDRGACSPAAAVARAQHRVAAGAAGHGLAHLGRAPHHIAAHRRDHLAADPHRAGGGQWRGGCEPAGRGRQPGGAPHPDADPGALAHCAGPHHPDRRRADAHDLSSRATGRGQPARLGGRGGHRGGWPGAAGARQPHCRVCRSA